MLLAGRASGLMAFLLFDFVSGAQAVTHSASSLLSSKALQMLDRRDVSDAVRATVSEEASKDLLELS